MTTKRVRMQVRGMTCDHCEGTVVKALQSAGASEATASFRREEATFTIKGDVDGDRFATAIKEVGYRPGSVEVLEAEAPRPTDGLRGGEEYDLAIIGSGSAAFAAAIKARDSGGRVVMVEESTLGGTCVNVGCVPSKALLRAAEVYYLAGNHSFAGIETNAGRVDLRALVEQKRDLVRTLRHEKYEEIVDAYDWEVLRGHAEFIDEKTLSVDGRAITANAYLIATGASPAVPPIEGLSEAGYLTSTTALELEQVPETLAIIGANAIGLELGQLFSRLGSRVTVIEIMPRIAPFEEPEISEALAEALRAGGMDIITGAQATKVDTGNGPKRLYVDAAGGRREVEVAHILVATGRRPNTAGLGLDKAGVDADKRGAVIVDETLRTSNPRVWAAGDVTPAPQFVYVAAHGGTLAAENALNGSQRRIDLSVVPRVTFTSPQVASVGLTEQQARDEGYEVKTAVLPASALSRAWVNQDMHALFKLVADAESDRLLGVHVLAESAGDVIYAAVIALKNGLTVAELVDTMAPYLTFAEGLRLAGQTFSRDVAKLSCCAG